MKLRFSLFSLLLLSATASHATSITWTGVNTGNWNTGTNWSLSAVPLITDDLTILGPGNLAGGLAINLSADANAKTINFTDTSAVSLTNTASGADKTLTLQGGLTTGTGAVTIGSTTTNQGVKIALGASQTWNIGSGGLTANNIISGLTFGITKTGTGTLTLNGANTYTGATAVNSGTFALGAGGTLAATAVTVNTGGMFAIKQTADGNTNSIGNAAFTLNAGSQLSMADGYTTTLNLAGAATLAPASGTSPILSFDINGANKDLLAITGAATVGAGGAKILITPNATATAGTYSVITAASGLNTNFSLVSSLLAAGNGLYTLALGGSATAEQVTVAADANALYWKGAGTAWNTAGNWTTDQAGTAVSGSAPATTTNVAFSASGAANLSTNTLTGALTVNSVNFLSGASSVTVASSANALTINGGGINDGSANAMTINNPITLGAAQTWTNTGSGLLTIGGAVTNGANNLTIAGAGNTTLSGAIGSGAGTLTMNGSGTLTLSSASQSNFTGATTINSGTVQYNASTAMSTGSAITLNGGTLALAADANTTFTTSAFAGSSSGNYTISVNQLTSAGAGKTLTLTSTAALGGLTTGTLNVTSTSGDTLAFTNALVLSQSTGTINLNGANMTVNGVSHGSANPSGFTLTSPTNNTLTINGNWASATARYANVTINSGTLTLNSTASNGGGANYGTIFNLNGGTLNINNGAAVGGVGGGNKFYLNGGTLDNTSGSSKTVSSFNPAIYLGGNFAFSTSAGTSANNLNLGTGAVDNNANRTITLNGAGSLTFGGTMTNTAGAINTLTVNNGSGTTATSAVNFTNYALSNSGTSYVDVINGSGNVNITGVVSNGSTATASGLTYGGTGTLKLSGTNTYAGATLVSGGTLLLSGTGASNSSSGITVNGSGAKFVNTSSVAASPTVTLTQGTLDGTGTINTVNVASLAGNTVQNGTGTGTGTLTIGALTFSGSGTLSIFEAGTTKGIGVTNALTTLNTGAAEITVNASNSSSWINGTTYNLLTFGSITGGVSDFTKGTISGLGVRQTAALALDAVTAKALQLTITGATPIWTGAASSVWSTTAVGTPYNWKLDTDSSATEFLATDTVLFNDTATITAVTINDATVSPTSTTFNNSTKNYTLSGTNGINTGTLTKSGTGTLTITNSNSYTGATTISGGTLQFGDGTTGKDGALTGTSGVTNNASLAYNLFGTSTASYGISGSGSVTKNGAGTLVLSGTNSYNGGTTINAGIIQAGSSSALGATTSGLTFGASSSGKLQVNGKALTVGSLNGDSTATIENSNATAGTLTVGSTGTDSFAGLLQNGSAGTLALTKSGAGTLILTGASTNTFTGATTISAGTLQFNAAAAMSTGSAITAAAGTTIALAADANTTFTPSSLNGASTSTNYTISVNQLTGAGAGKTLTLANFNASNGGNITVSSTSGDTLQLSSAFVGNNYAYNTPANGTFLNLVNANVVFNNGVSTADTCLTLTSATGNTLTVNGNVAGQGGNQWMNFWVNSGTLTLNNTVSGSGINWGDNVTLNGGTLNLNTNTVIGGAGGGNGLYLLSGTLDNTSASAKTLANNPGITLGGNFAFSTSAGTSANNLNLGTGTVTNGGNYTITINGAGALTFGGTMTNTLAGINTLTVNNGSGTTATSAVNFAGYALSNSATSYVDVINGSGNVNITGAITDGGSATASGLTYSGAGKLTLTGVNTYRGATTISTGTLQLGNGSTLGTLATTGTIVDNGNLAIYRSNPVVQGTDFSSAAITGTGSFTQAGDGTTTLNAANAYTGTTTISAGTLNAGVADVAGVSGALGNGGNITFSGGKLQYSAASASSDYSARIKNSTGAIAVDTNGQSATFASALVSSNTGGLTKSGSGSLTLAGANTYTGATAILAGTLQYNAASAMSTASAISIASGATLALAADANTTFTPASVTGPASNYTISVNQLTGAGANKTLTLANFNGFTGGVSTLSVSSSSGDTLQLSSAYMGSSNFASPNSPSTINLNNANLVFNNGISGADPFFILSSATGNSLTINGTVTQNGGNEWAMAQVNSGTLILNNTVTILGGLNNGFGVNLNGGTLNYNAAGAIAGAGDGNNNRGGSLNITSGTLDNTSGSALTATGLSFLNINGDFTFAGSNSLNLGAGAANLGASVGTTRTLTTNGAATLTLGGILANGTTATGITKAGTGTLTLTGANTYTGKTTVSAGVLALGAGGSIANSSELALNGGNFNVTALSGFTMGSSQSLTGSGSVTGDITIPGTLAIGNSPGTVTFNNNLTIGSAANSNFEFIDGSFGSGTYDRALGGAGSTVTFGGTLSLLFSGGTYTTGSTVQIFSFDNYAGGFSTVNFSGLDVGQSATFNSATGFVTVVPESGSALLGGLGLLALLRRRRVRCS